jgi:predicted anti-sigma-YlaC factor YlaD
MTITCDRVIEQLLEFLEGDVEQHVHIAIEHHIGICPHCGGLLEQYRATIVITRSLPRCAPPIPPSLDAKLRAILEQHLG